MTSIGYEPHSEPRPAADLAGLTGPLGQQLQSALDQIREIAASHNVRLLAVFGSVARGEDNPDSDVDLLVELPLRMGLVGLARLERELEGVLGATIDIVPERDLKPRMRAVIEHDAILL